MNSPNVYSLWLMPVGEARNELAKIISDLSKEYAAPRFSPHVTLIGGLTGAEEDLLAKSMRLAARLQPYEIRLVSIGYLDEFYRCLFARVEETAPVMDANQQARQVFERQNDSPYMPHLSLMYGNFDSSVKEKIIARIGAQVRQRFRVSSVHLMATGGETQDWHHVREFALTRPTGESFS